MSKRTSKRGHAYDKQTVGTEAATFPKNKQWAIDQDYIDALKRLACGVGKKAEEARDALLFVSKFNNEYYAGAVKKGDDTALHNTERLRKDCYARNNASNRDLSSIRGQGLLSLESIQEKESKVSNE